MTDHVCVPQPLPEGWKDKTVVRFAHPTYGYVELSNEDNKWRAWSGRACIATANTWPLAVKYLINYHHKQFGDL